MRALVLVVALLVGACVPDRTPPGVTVADSAGVIITLSPDVSGTYATVDPRPLVSLGGPNAEGPEQFFRIDRVLLNRDELWVADGQSAELRVFSTDGSHLRTLGRRGAGPGEFTLLRLLGTFAGDSVAAWDQSSGRLTVYDANGASLRTTQLEASGRGLPRPWEVYPDGSVLGQVRRIVDFRTLVQGEIIPASVDLVRFDLRNGEQTDAGRAEGRRWLWTGNAQLAVPFTDDAAFGVRGEELHLVAGPDFRVQVFQRGRVIRIYGVDRGVRNVSTEDVADYRAFIEEFYPPDQAEDMLALLDHAATPSVLPAYRRILVAAEGSVWAQRYAPVTLWDVFDPDGELLGQVETPTNFYPMSIRGDRLAGVWRDDLGVEYVQVYEMGS